MAEDLYVTCIEKAYEMVSDRDAWPAFLDSFGRYIGAKYVHCIAWGDRAHTAPMFSAASRTTPTDCMQAYASYYGRIDPFRELCLGPAQARWVSCQEAFDARTITKSEFTRIF